MQSSVHASAQCSKILHLLTKDSTATLVHSFVTSKLDKHNSLLYGCAEHKLSRLEKLQNTSADIIAKTKKYDHIAPVFIDLCCLPVLTRIVFRICARVLNCLQLKTPQYLHELIIPYQPSRLLRSVDQQLLTPPSTKECKNKTWGKRSF